MSDKREEQDERESIWERCYYWFYAKECSFEMCLRRIYCFLAGHGEIGIRDYWDHEPNRCQRCFADWPEETTTVPRLLNRFYCWIVAKNWPWFERLDWWLSNNYGKYLPGWWEY